MVPSGIMKGWAMCTCGSMPPGMTILAVASTTRVASPSASVPGDATAAMVSPLMARSQRVTPCGVTTSPPRMIRSSMRAPSSSAQREVCTIADAWKRADASRDPWRVGRAEPGAPAVSVDAAPDAPLGKAERDCREDEIPDHQQPHALALLQRRVGHPGQEGHHVAGVVVDGG